MNTTDSNNKLTLAWYTQMTKQQQSIVIKDIVSQAHIANENNLIYLSIDDDYIENHITHQLQQWPLFGAPIAIKDNILLKNTISTAWSKILEWYKSPYTATCIQNMINQGWLVIGKTNMDEFAMGWSTEHSAYGVTLNPHGTDRVAWWSSWGSAVAVAVGTCVWALGSDTGGSIRQPAAFCGIVGLKPTYGRVSRYGVIAMGSSLDQVGTFTHTVRDSALLLRAIAWQDPLDATSIQRSDMDSREYCFGQTSLVWKRIGLPYQFVGEWLDPQIKNHLMNLIWRLKEQWAQVDMIDMPLLEASVPIYYTLMPAEVTTNMARFDGLRFGLQDNTLGYDSIPEYVTAMRSRGFGSEVQRRIMIGNYVLSSEQYEWSYIKAQKLRNILKADFDRVYKDYDIIIWPTTPECAWKVWSHGDDPLKDYLSDIYTIPANLVWCPAISLPMGMIVNQWEQMPVGVQLMADCWREDLLFEVWDQIEHWYKNIA